MTPEDNKYYEELFETFSTKGWEHITSKLNDILVAKDSIRSVPEGGLEFRQGELSMLAYLIDFEDAHKDMYDTISEE